VIGEHVVWALASVGPGVMVPDAMVLLEIEIRYKIGPPDVFPQTYRPPVSFEELK
jgi:hypothetical protein